MSSGPRLKSTVVLTSPKKMSPAETSTNPDAEGGQKTEKDIKKEGAIKRLNLIDANIQQSTKSDDRANVVSDMQMKTSKMVHNVCGKLQRMKIKDAGQYRATKEEAGKSSEPEEPTQKTMKPAYDEDPKLLRKEDRRTARLAKKISKFSAKFMAAARELGVVDLNEDYNSDSDSSWSLTNSSLCSTSCSCSESCTTDYSSCSCSICCSDEESSSTSGTADASTTDSSSESSTKSASYSLSSDNRTD
ncbi:uncharacterized protein [Neodiprion pinetum]|uniref:uncharacterized protein isoform X1 n=1 Tax=Neodiprion pinetum TaxID=441929 RepID=UPI001EDD5ECD|nr:uncharacterized protein LOC124212117 isoform X1 [Neodiprion pinetum]